MPRRRMIGPEFWTDRYIATLDRNERLLVVGCIGNGDDEGRLVGHPAYLKAAIFMYDDDLDASAVEALRDSCLSKMASWPSTHPYRFASYQNSGETYLAFPSWFDIEKPSHPTKSKLPPPPPETLPIFSGSPPETVVKTSGESPSQSSLGQSSLGQVSLGKVRGVQEDFTKFIKSNDLTGLTDFLTVTLKNYLPARPLFAFSILSKMWRQITGDDMKPPQTQYTHDAVKKYTPEVLAEAYAKAVKYGGGRTGSWKYLQKVLEEKAGAKDRSP